MIYYLIALVPYIVQLFFIIHIIRNHKPYYWLFLVLFLPYIGGLAYFFIEILPSLVSSRTGRKIGQNIAKTVNPMGNIKKLKEQIEIQDTVSNRMQLAAAYADAGMYAEAAEWYSRCLTGPYKDDRSILFPLADAWFHLGKIEEARAVLDKLEKEKPFDMLNEQLLVLLVRQAGGEDVSGVLEQLYSRSHNFEAGYYYVQNLVTRGEHEKASAVVKEMQDTLKNFRNFRDTMGREWVSRSEKELRV